MKKNRLFLFLSTAVLLTSCGGDTSIRRDDREGSSSTSVSIIDDDDIYSNITSSITTSEMQTIIDTAKKGLNGIQSVTSKYAYISYKYDSNYTNQSVNETNSLTSKTLCYSNSVLYTNNSATNFSDFKKFNFVSSSEEKRLSTFIYLNLNDEEGRFIEKRSVYQKDGETSTTVKIDEKVDYSPTNYDDTFTLIKEDDIYDVSSNLDKVEVIGVLNDGNTIARFILKNEETTSKDGSTLVNVQKCDYIYKNNNLVNINLYVSQYYKDADSKLYPYEIMTVSNSFSYTENGSYDKNQIPSVSVSK